MSATPPNTKLGVLLVEDSIEDVYLVRAFLEKTGLFQVTTSQDGDHAARLIEEHVFDLVITDLNLPGKDGYDLIRLVKATIPDVPVIATTGYTAPHYHEHAYRSSADDVVVKPLDRDDFLGEGTRIGGSGGRVGALPLRGARDRRASGGCREWLWKRTAEAPGARRWCAPPPPQRVHRGWRPEHRCTESCR
jgi:CheY-like chemotaxis protein